MAHAVPTRPVYKGGKWGVYLRAPDVFFQLTDAYKAGFVPLRTLAEIRRGITSGCDAFFFVQDITDQALEENSSTLFRRTYGITAKQANKIRIVRSGDGSVHTIEDKYLDPEIHSLMEIDSVTISTDRLRRKVLLCDRPVLKLRGSRILRYIKWGEKQAFNQRPTCVAREPWYDLTGARRAPIIFPKIQQYRHIAVWNEARHVCASSLLQLFPKDNITAKALCAVMNSTVTALIKHVYGRIHGREGSLQVDVYAANMMLVPDIRRADDTLLQSLSSCVDRIGSRKTLNLPDEFDLDDRRDLDDLVLQMIGMTDARCRVEFRQCLYEQIREMYRAIREAELKMQKLRTKNAQRSKVTPRSLAESIWDTFDKASLRFFPRDFVPSEAKNEGWELAPAKKKIKVQTDLFGNTVVTSNGQSYCFSHPDRAAFAARLLQDGVTGKGLIPINPDVCCDALAEYEEYVGELGRKFEEAAAELTAKEDWQAKTIAELWKLYRSARH
jgi:hypothetical protein